MKHRIRLEFIRIIAAVAALLAAMVFCAACGSTDVVQTQTNAPAAEASSATVAALSTEAAAGPETTAASETAAGTETTAGAEDAEVQETRQEMPEASSDQGTGTDAAGASSDKALDSAQSYTDPAEEAGTEAGADNDDAVDVGQGPQDNGPAVSHEAPPSPAEMTADVGIGPGAAVQTAAEAEAGSGMIDISEAPDPEEVPVSGEIPTAASFTVFNEDSSISYVVPEPQKPYEYIRWENCLIEGDEVLVSGVLEGGITPANTRMGEDTNLYLLELEPYEDSIENHRFVDSLPKNAADLTFRLPLQAQTRETRLYKRFVACIWDEDHYIQVSDPIAITNPEAIASCTLAYTEPLSKKGLLIEKAQIADAFSLGVCNVIVNIPFNHLMGEGIDYEYDGEVYHFNKQVVETYDKTISVFSNKSMNVSAVLLNGYNEAHPDFFYPGTVPSSAARYHQFNAATPEGCRMIEAVASFLAMRYNGTDGDHGKVQNWIIGNEINNQEWNYLGPMSQSEYVREYERSFRIFYNAIRSTSANARVFFSLDHNWNRHSNGRTRYNARDVLSELAALIRRQGNIDWGLAYHPYSEPMTEPEFWDDFNTGQVTYYEDSPVVNFANISLLTDFMQKEEMRDRGGHVRHIILSEEGFTSQSLTRGEVQELQAAAFAYAYYIADSNLYIDAFILSRQVDAPSELRSSLAFGLWTTSSITDANIQPLQRKYIWDVFKNIDRRATTLQYTAFAKEILGIEKWSEVIPNFRWARYE